MSTDSAPDSALVPSFFARPPGQLPSSHYEVWQRFAGKWATSREEQFFMGNLRRRSTGTWATGRKLMLLAREADERRIAETSGVSMAFHRQGFWPGGSGWEHPFASASTPASRPTTSRRS